MSRDIDESGAGERAALAPPETEETSVSELFHENSKQQRYDIDFARRIHIVNNDPAFQRVIARTFKSYAGATIVPLPAVTAGDGPSVEHAIAERRSERAFDGGAISVDELARLLHFGNGTTGSLSNPGLGVVRPVRAAPSGGALYPTELYVVMRPGGTVDAGVYHYYVARHELELLQGGDRSAVLEEAAFEPALGRMSAAIVIASVFARPRFKYGERGYRFALLECGHVAQNILLTAAALHLAAFPLGGFVDDEVNELLGLDGVDEAAVYVIAVGRPVRETPRSVPELLEMFWSAPAEDS